MIEMVKKVVAAGAILVGSGDGVPNIDISTGPASGAIAPKIDGSAQAGSDGSAAEIDISTGTASDAIAPKIDASAGHANDASASQVAMV